METFYGPGGNMEGDFLYSSFCLDNIRGGRGANTFSMQKVDFFYHIRGVIFLLKILWADKRCHFSTFYTDGRTLFIFNGKEA